MDHSHTLLLNSSYEPMSIISWQKAIELLMGNKVYVLEEYDKEVRSAYLVFKIPAVVVLKKYAPVKSKVKFSRKNIYLRDEFTCQFCGTEVKKLKNGIKDLTFDHVLPRCQGGITTWTNIVTACWKCNHKKGGQTPEQAKMRLIRKPEVPKLLPMFAISLFGKPHTPDQWKSYLYWETALEES